MYPSAYHETQSSHDKNYGEEAKLIQELADPDRFRKSVINRTAGFTFLLFQHRRVKENSEESNGNKKKLQKSEG